MKEFFLIWFLCGLGGLFIQAFIYMKSEKPKEIRLPQIFVILLWGPISFALLLGGIVGGVSNSFTKKEKKK